MESCLLRPPLCPPRVSSWKGASTGCSRARMRGWSRAEAQGMQEKAGAEPKKQPTRLGLGNKRERAGRGKGRPRKAKRGSYSRAGAGGGAGRGGELGGAGRGKRPELGPTQAADAEGARRPKPSPARPGPARPGPPRLASWTGPAALRGHPFPTPARSAGRHAGGAVCLGTSCDVGENRT